MSLSIKHVFFFMDIDIYFKATTVNFEINSLNELQ